MSQEAKTLHEVQESPDPAFRDNICNWNVIAYYLPKQLYWIVYPSNGAAAAAIMVEEDKKKQ